MKEKGGYISFLSLGTFTKMHKTSLKQDPRLEIPAGEGKSASSNAFHYSQ